jgi:AraC-like DNA-binding protein
MPMYKYFIACTNSLLSSGINSLVVSGGMDLEFAGKEENEEKAFRQIEISAAEIIIADTHITDDINDSRPDALRLRERIIGELKRRIYFIYILHRGGWHDVPDDSFCCGIYEEECNSDSIHNILDNAVIHLEADKRQRRLFEDETIYETKNLLMNHFLVDVLKGNNVTGCQVKRFFRENDLDCSGSFYRVVQVCLQHKKKETIGKDLYQKMLVFLKKQFNCYFLNLTVGISGECICIILISDQSNPDPEIRRACEEILKNASGMGLEFFDIRLLFGIGPEVNGFPNISYSYAYSRLGINACIRQQLQVSYGTNPEQISFAEFEQAVRNDFEKKDAQDFSRHFLAFGGRIGSMEFGDVIHCLSIITQIYITTFPDGQKRLSEALGKTSTDDCFGWQILYSCNSYREAEDYMEKLGILVSGALLKEKRSSRKDLLEQAKEYIGEHTEDNITLADVAGLIGVSQSYLSSLFRKNLHTGFSEYVTDQKMRMACMMMHSGDRKICEVSEAVGFSTPQYFSRVFKKRVGVKPTEYAANLSGGRNNK